MFKPRDKIWEPEKSRAGARHRPHDSLQRNTSVTDSDQQVWPLGLESITLGSNTFFSSFTEI